MLAKLAEVLAKRQGPMPSDSKKNRGAVAILIKEESDDLWLLMIRRRENPKDPWSGQMGFPGGRADLRDRTLFDTVARETTEEVGINVRSHKFLGCLRNVQPKNVPMIVSPFVFLAVDKVNPVTSSEAVETLWVPLSFLLDPKNVSSFTLAVRHREVAMGRYKYSNRIIWGMSFRIIQEVLKMLPSLER